MNYYFIIYREKPNSSLCYDVTSVMSDSATLWTIAFLAPLSMGVFRQKYWSGLPIPSPGDLPDPGSKPMSLMSPALAGGSLPLAPPGKSKFIFRIYQVYVL